MAHKIKINGIVYGNVGTITPSIEKEYYHNVTALSGRKHQKVRYTKTNQTVQFFNLLDGVYTGLREYINNNEDVAIVCGFPNDEDGYDEAEYYLTIKSEISKGILSNGNYYKNGLIVFFEKVEADE